MKHAKNRSRLSAAATTALALATAVAFLLPTPAAAAPPVASLQAHHDPSPVGVKLRLTLPYGAVDHVNASRNLSRVLGGAATLELYEMLGIEAGGTWLRGDGEDGSYDVYARLGAVPVVLDRRDVAGAGWTMQVGALWGWRWLHRETDVDGHTFEEDSHGFTATGSLETTYWWAAGFGLNVRATFEFGIPLTRSDEGAWVDGEYRLGETTDWYLGGGLMLGLAF